MRHVVLHLAILSFSGSRLGVVDAMWMSCVNTVSCNESNPGFKGLPVLHVTMTVVAWYKFGLLSYTQKVDVFKMPVRLQNAMAVFQFHQRTWCC